jgi:hypothetical protein
MKRTNMMRRMLKIQSCKSWAKMPNLAGLWEQSPKRCSITEKYRPKQLKRDELTQPGWWDTADEIHE